MGRSSPRTSELVGGRAKIPTQAVWLQTLWPHLIFIVAQQGLSKT